MRNKLWGLFVLCAVFFTACADDDDNGNGATYSGDNLSLTVAGMQLDGREATLDGSTLTVKQAMPGESETAFQVENSGSQLSGTNSNENRDVNLTGTIDGSKLNLTLTMDVKHKLAAQWDVEGLQSENHWPISRPGLYCESQYGTSAGSAQKQNGCGSGA